MRKKNWKKASFTVEAAFLVPAATIVLVLLIGYIYFVHERAWTVSAAGEACFYALQRAEGAEKPEDLLQERLQERSSEAPLGLQEAAYTIKSGSNAFQISAAQNILPEAFGDTFSLETEVSVRRFDPAAVKRLAWVGNYVLDR